ncbi:sulfatase-like hydrolase/transferase [Thiopseudomonas denitrificans]|uniref:Sulfatase N-terminal domain-containing protein n=1 Tax=Thiopseudomonas denitrificans TaxID=1501432 RepID=A0A4R6TYI8_9GAMM|nr:sulfatase-like hydrolase/transferase [Thiopseudomonas denitrificans]TDQ39000.1 hypothetical protein DFQ45_103170 [Thiopseudomonas denitrificans]
MTHTNKALSSQSFLLLGATLLAWQIVMYCAASYFHIGRPLLNIDYAFILILSFFTPRPISILLFLIVILIDYFMLPVQILPFTRLIDFIYFIGKLEFINRSITFSLAGCIILAITVSIFTMNIAKKSSKLTLILTFNLFIISSAISKTITEESHDNRFYRVANKYFSDSVFLYAYNYRTSGFVSSSNLKNQSLSETKDTRALCININCDLPPENKTLFIINESWGDYKDPKTQEEILKPVNSWILTKGTISFTGLTVEAELKELCGLHAESLYFKETNIEDFKNCYPEKIKKLGYKTYSYHAAGSMMYDRHHWYPLAGFEKSTFFDTQKWPARCYSFPGACDKDIAQKIINDIKKPGIALFYWLTLNTHHNYNLKDLKTKTFNCKELDIKNNEICRNAKLQNQFFLILKNIILNLSELEENLTIIIVGDHSPPITNTQAKELYFNTKKVPYIKIKLQHRNTK